MPLEFGRNAFVNISRTPEAVYGDGGTSIVPFSIKFLDSPNTTSQVTYQAYFKVQNSTGYFNVNGNTGSIILMEIGA